MEKEFKQVEVECERGCLVVAIQMEILAPLGAVHRQKMLAEVKECLNVTSSPSSTEEHPLYSHIFLQEYETYFHSLLKT